MIYKGIKTEKGLSIVDISNIKNLKDELAELNGHYEIELRSPKRSTKQNNGLHAYFRRVAQSLNESGFTWNVSGITVDFTEATVKDLYKKLATGGEATSKQSTKDTANQIEVFEKAMLELGLEIYFID